MAEDRSSALAWRSRQSNRYYAHRLKSSRRRSTARFLCLGIVCALAGRAIGAEFGSFGAFVGHGDVGAVQRAGVVKFDPASQTYSVSASGENMWGSTDAFHFVWQRLSGDLTLTADVNWVGTGGNPHRKASLIVRASLEAGSPYVDAVVHGNGLTSLQFRAAAGERTREVQANVSAPKTLRLERRGDTFLMSVGRAGEPLDSAGCSVKLSLPDPVYVGLAVCAHDAAAMEQATFSNVQITNAIRAATTNLVLESSLETISVASEDRRVVYHARELFEAPNWSRDGQWLLFNQGGRLYKLPVQGGVPTVINTDFANRCNNDHGLSPDGTQLAISHHHQGKSLIYTLPIEGGTPRLITPEGPSYWHGWSPDGSTLAYCAERNGAFDIYTIPAAGGPEKRLTDAPGLDDGPDYSPDGQWLYFNSERTGAMKIWRLKPDGSQPEQMTFDEFNDWFPHPSPDGQWVVFVSYEKGVTGHPANHDVLLRLMPLKGGAPKVIAKLFGGQGTLNVPSWSPDSRSLAFVSYRFVPPPLAR